MEREKVSDISEAQRVNADQSRHLGQYIERHGPMAFRRLTHQVKANMPHNLPEEAQYDYYMREILKLTGYGN